MNTTWMTNPDPFLEGPPVVDTDLPEVVVLVEAGLPHDAEAGAA